MRRPFASGRLSGPAAGGAARVRWRSSATVCRRGRTGRARRWPHGDPCAPTAVHAMPRTVDACPPVELGGPRAVPTQLTAARTVGRLPGGVEVVVRAVPVPPDRWVGLQPGDQVAEGGDAVDVDRANGFPVVGHAAEAGTAGPDVDPPAHPPPHPSTIERMFEAGAGSRARRLVAAVVASVSRPVMASWQLRPSCRRAGPFLT